ncbi:ComEC/Rec2 family competence protein [Chryseolinea soli]|uniref:ComEC family competence protein n=1 Tax=Chryseolinea soli TaxID=2321403 RepID=A0A385SM73_9BACT|nr:ComEC/Rec2 family competence protein [Chryseolinea soli]AYB32084.1 ComEC family competence protein [Chryseolinea soli]
MNRWIPYAFVRMVVFLCGGILLAIHLPDVIDALVAQALLVVLIVMYFVFALTYRRWQLNPGAFGLLAIFVAAFSITLQRTASRSDAHFLHLKTPVAYYTAVATKPSEEKSKSWKLEVAVRQVNTAGQWMPRHGNVLLYLSKQDFKKPFAYGDVLLVKGTPQSIPAPGNPGEFDYRQYLSYRQIYHQQFVHAGEVKQIAYDPPGTLMRHAIAVRLWADGVIRRFVPGEREYGLASALVLGVTDGLDNEVLQAYAATGALHVLSVSGLHVGIVYWLLLLVLRPLQKTYSGKWILAVVSILVLWGYAFVTGLSPSVLRAVTMFSFMALARPMNRQMNIYNTLAASAFCLLLVDPFMIMSVGFQLSYLALLGIVYFQPGLYTLWEPKGRLWDEIWKVSSVSLAAQFATFTVGLLYFHQFPNYFLIANFVVIPASFGVLIAGLVLLAVSAMPAVAGFLGMMLGWIVQVMNGFVFGLENLPFSKIDNVYITPWQFAWLTAMLFCLVRLLETRKMSWLITACFAAVGFAMLDGTYVHEQVDQRHVTVYKVSGHTAVDLMHEGTVFSWADTALMQDRSKVKFHLAPNRIIYGAQETASQPPLKEWKGCTLMVWHGKSILRIYEPEFSLPSALQVDYLILSHNAVRDLSSVLSKVATKQIIIDSSNKFYLANRLLQQAKERDEPVYSVWHDGAFDRSI